MEEQVKNFRDPIHGFIDVYPHEVEIISDPIFQRLRRIKQLSFGYYVYHGAEHSRFGHCIGAMHLASKVLDYIEANTKKFDPDFKISTDDRKALRLAALLHDVGHKPFSHALDRTIAEKHEDYSIHLIKTRFADIIKKAGIEPEYVVALIEGKPDPEKGFLANLISGQLDVDKLDYLLRDSLYTGVKYGVYDLDRLIANLCVRNTDLVVMDGGSYAAIQLVLARYFMFEQVYLHKTKRVYEGMANKIASHLIKNGKLDYLTIQDLNKKNDEFTRYDDAWFLDKILETREPYYKRIAELINNRQHYKEVYNSIEIRQRMLKKDNRSSIDDANGFLNALEIDINSNLSSLGIDESEIIFDSYTNLPYRLRPYSKPLEYESTEEPVTIYIYNGKNDLVEPIEDVFPFNNSQVTPLE